MTEVVKYRCKDCEKEYGPLGMHGFNPKEGNGELPMVCKECKIMLVGKFEENKLVNSKCSKCSKDFENFKNECPNCGSKNMQWTDIRMGPNMWMDCK